MAVSNVTLTWQLPSGVSNVGGTASSGRLVTQSFGSLGADSSQNVTLTLKSNIGLTMDTGDQFAHDLQLSELDHRRGVITPLQITVKEDILSSYEIPVAIAIIVALAALVYMRRGVAPAVIAAPSAPT